MPARQVLHMHVPVRQVLLSRPEKNLECIRARLEVPIPSRLGAEMSHLPGAKQGIGIQASVQMPWPGSTPFHSC